MSEPICSGLSQSPDVLTSSQFLWLIDQLLIQALWLSFSLLDISSCFSCYVVACCPCPTVMNSTQWPGKLYSHCRLPCSGEVILKHSVNVPSSCSLSRITGSCFVSVQRLRIMRVIDIRLLHFLGKIKHLVSYSGSLWSGHTVILPCISRSSPQKLLPNSLQIEGQLLVCKAYTTIVYNVCVTAGLFAVPTAETFI